MRKLTQGQLDVTFNKALVGLGNVDNTSDANKPVSTATQTALDLKAPLDSPSFTGTFEYAGENIFWEGLTPAATPSFNLSNSTGTLTFDLYASTTAVYYSHPVEARHSVAGTRRLTISTTGAAVTGTLSATGNITGANLSGTNTGDQTNITGNAGTATALQNARNINGVSFDGTANITINAVDSTARIAASEKGAANGVATLDGSSKIPTSQLPALALTDVYTVGTQAAQLALTAEEGDVAIRSDLNKSFVHNGGVTGTMADWSEILTPTDQVLSVTLTQPAAGITLTNSGSGQTGAVSSTFALANDLAAVEGLSSTGIVRRTAADTWSAGTAVALSEIATQAANTFVANATGVAAAPTAISAATATSILDTFTTTLKGLVPAPSTSTGKYLKDNGTWDAPGGGAWGSITGTLADQTDLNTALSGKQPLDAQLTDLSALSYTGNANKYVRVNSGATAFELAAFTAVWANPVTAVGTGVSQNITLPESGLSPKEVLVFVDGIRWETDEYTIVGTTLTLTTNLNGESIEIIKNAAMASSGGGSGTVTEVSVTTANGVSGTVATATTTPAITLTLGAITPSSVASSGAVSGTTATFSSTLAASNFQTNFAGFCSGKPANSEVVLGAIAPVAFTMSQTNTVAKATVAATASTVFTIAKDGTAVGTITFGAAATSGTVSITSGAITADQNITVTAPATADATLANISFLLRA